MRSLEEALHKGVAKLLFHALEQPSLSTCFPSGGGGATRGAILKAKGLRAGMPDHLVIAPGVNLWIELKVPKGGRVALEQKAAHADLRALGHKVEVCRSIEEVIAALDKHGVPHRVRPGRAA